MIRLRLDELARVVGGTVADPRHHGVVVDAPAYLDSRDPVPGGLYVAVVGERVDGHVHAGGAHAVLGSRPTDAPTVVVDDPVVALGRLARHVLDGLRVPTLAMTGSQGKTGTKDYLAHVLADHGPTVATRGNLNNELGVPLTALRADAGTEHLVVEMGARGIGHVAYLCEVAPPTVAAVLNVGTAHIGEFGSAEAIAVAKGEIVEALPAAGTAVLNADDPLVAAMASRTRARVLTFGGPGADVSGLDVELDDLGRPAFVLAHGEDRAAVRLAQVGAHQVANATAAAAMALAVGVPLEAVATSLSTARAASRWRMELTEREDGLVVLNDAYNANPASMVAALDALAAIRRRTGRRAVAVLGEMLELGPGAEQAHRDVGRAAAERGTDVLLVVGAPALADGAREVAGWAGEVVLAESRDEATAWVRENAGARDAVLVKASRGAALEEVAAALVGPDPAVVGTHDPTGEGPAPMSAR